MTRAGVVTWRCSATLALLAAACCRLVRHGSPGRDRRAARQAAQTNTQLGVDLPAARATCRGAREARQGARAGPRRPERRCARAAVNERLDDDRKARAHYDQAREARRPNNPDVHEQLRGVPVPQGETEARREAVRCERAGTSSTARPGGAYTNAGACCARRRRNADAERYFRRRSPSGPNYAGALLQLADLDREQRQCAAGARVPRALPGHRRRRRRGCCWLGVRIERSSATAPQPTSTRAGCAGTSPTPPRPPSCSSRSAQCREPSANAAMTEAPSGRRRRCCARAREARGLTLEQAAEQLSLDVAS